MYKKILSVNKKSIFENIFLVTFFLTTSLRMIRKVETKIGKAGAIQDKQQKKRSTLKISTSNLKWLLLRFSDAAKQVP